MKKLLFFLVLSTIASVLCFTSCVKEEASQEDKVQSIEDDATTEITEFQEAVVYGISLLKENESLLIWKEEGKYDWDVVENRNLHHQVSSRAPHDCENSSAVKFAKCVKKLIDDGKCVPVGYSDGEYWGDITDCP